MNERTEKQPIDELFARKLENMSLPPSQDGFARLQARMGQGGVAPKVVFWREPTIQRYMAVAACLLLVCLFSWLYLASTGNPVSKGNVAVSQPPKSTKDDDQRKPQPVNNPESNIAGTQAGPERVLPGKTNDTPVKSPFHNIDRAKGNVVEAGDQAIAVVKQPAVKIRKPSPEVPILETARPVEQIAKTDVSPVVVEPIVDRKVAATTGKPTPATERVLVVTIAEPEALVAARRTVKASVQDEAVANVEAKDDKETKAGTLWSQVKRLKQGEIFARKDESDDERGLIGRAYSGLKHSLDKDKSIKQ